MLWLGSKPEKETNMTQILGLSWTHHVRNTDVQL